MKYYSTAFIALLALFFPTLQNSYGQYFSVGNDPAGIRWKEIRHEKMSLIYPDYYENAAISLFESGLSILPNVGNSLFLKPSPFRSVVHPESIVSNGYTLYVPRKIDLLPIPSLDIMAEKYSDHLLIHEFRHIVQLDKMDQGLTRVLGWFLGDQASASVQALQFPDWASEGDAVLTESLLSHSGRGRNPAFSQGMRAVLMNDCNNKFDKARLGSYRDFVPDYYVLGYYIVSAARLIDGNMFWSDALDNIARKPYRVANFNRFLHKRTGLWQAGLYRETKKLLCDYWNENSTILGGADNELIINDSTDYFNYLKPYPESDTSWICLKRSYGNIPSVIRIYKNSKEEHILYPGSINDDSFSFSGKTIAWAQQIADPRWEMRSFSDIFIYNVGTGKKSRLTKNKRYLYPVLNPASNMIAVIEERIDGTGHLVILDREGTVLHSVAADAGSTFRQPVWPGEGDKLYALRIGREGKKLIEWHFRENSIDVIYDFGYKEVSGLAILGDSFIFTAPAGTVQGLYSLDPENDGIRKMFVPSNGLGYTVVKDGRLCVSVFTKNGYRPAELAVNRSANIKLNEVEDLKEPILSQLERVGDEYPVNYLTGETGEIVPRPYRKLAHLFNFHSWAPVAYDIDQYSIRPGIMALSQNDLNTLVSSIGIQTNRQSGGIDYFSDFEYTGLYPKIGVNLLAGWRKADSLMLGNDRLKDVSYFDIRSGLSVSIPLFYSTGAYYQRLRPYFFIRHHRYFKGLGADQDDGIKAFDLSYATAGAGISGQLLRRMSYRDLFPKWGIAASVEGEAGITDPQVRASGRIAAYMQLYMPGILKNHSLRTYAGIARQNDLGLTDLPFVSLPRGHYEAVNYSYSSFKLDYAFPIAYPDWSIPAVLYITRFKANAFFDGAYLDSRQEPWSLRTGLDLSSNFYLFRIKAEIDAGIRIIYNPVENNFDFELLYSFDIE